MQALLTYSLHDTTSKLHYVSCTCKIVFHDHFICQKGDSGLSPARQLPVFPVLNLFIHSLKVTFHQLLKFNYDTIHSYYFYIILVFVPIKSISCFKQHKSMGAIFYCCCKWSLLQNTITLKYNYSFTIFTCCESVCCFNSHSPSLILS